jgi:Brp/Blh family beta-carotene 15,15'-monooxygenase
MNVSNIFLYHRLFFVCIALAVLVLEPSISPSLKGLELFFAFVLFFGLGIPHGALDLTLGRFLLKPKLGLFWWVAFLMAYLTCVGFIVTLWILYPLPCFLFFLLISVFHFGSSDTLDKTGLMRILEAIARGILPISAPAYWDPEDFQKLVESSLSTAQASLVLQVASTLYYPLCILLLTLIIQGLFGKDRYSFWNSLELTSILLLFTFLTPLKAFLIYFCFLHAIRHLITVMEDMKLPFKFASVWWIFLQAMPSTIFTLIALGFCYFYMREGAVDTKRMMNLFFVSLASLTFPHTLLVETVKYTR